MRSTEVDAYIVEIKATPELHPLFHRFGIAYRWYAMLAVVSANIAAVLASTIINVAVPDIMGAFGIGQDDAQWLATANLAAATISMLCSAWMVSRIGLRGTVLLGMSIFLLGSLMGGLATNLETMVVSRILQGIPAGLLTPLSMTVIFQVFPLGKRGLAMGISAIGIILAPAIGPAAGGLAVDALSWRYVFYLGAPFSVMSLILGSIFLPGRGESKPAPFDWFGLILLTIALISLLIALSNGEQDGWNSNRILGHFFIAVLFGTLFVSWERRQSHPLLALELFAQRNFAIISTVGFVFGAGLYASTYLVPLFLQLVQHLTATASGFLLMPAGFIMVLIFPLSGRLADRYDQRMLITVGSAFFALAFWLLASADASTSFWTLAFWVVLSRIGVGLVMPALQMGALAGIAQANLNAASGSFSFMRQLGGAFGVNLSSVLLEQRTQMHRASFIDSQTYANSDVLEVMQSLGHYAAQLGFSGTETWNAARFMLLQMIHSQALIAGFKDNFLILSLVFLAALVPTWMLRRSVSPTRAG